MKILCLGGGPAGLYFAISMKLRDASHEVTVLERNRANDTFGWGVVLSDDALSRMQQNDPISTKAIRANFAYWDDIAVIHKGVRTVSGGHGFAGIGRQAFDAQHVARLDAVLLAAGLEDCEHVLSFLHFPRSVAPAMRVFWLSPPRTAPLGGGKQGAPHRHLRDEHGAWRSSTPIRPGKSSRGPDVIGCPQAVGRQRGT